MTTKEAHIRIQNGLQSLGSFLYLDLGKETIDLLLEAFMYKMIREVLSPEGTMKYSRTPRNTQYADNELRRSDIATLEVRDKSLSSGGAGVFPNTTKWVLPTGASEYFLHLIGSVSTLTKGTCAGIVSPNRDYHLESVNSIVQMSLSKPTSESPIANHDNQWLYVYTDGSFTITGVTIDYIRKPIKPDVTISPNAELDFAPSAAFKLVERVIQWGIGIAEQNQAKQAAVNFIAAQTQ